MADIFISYKRSERGEVEKIATLLRKENLNVWFDAKLEIGRDEGFQAQIEREVTSAGCVIVCWTQEASKSIWVKSEAIKGMERDVLVPVYLNKCSLPLPFNALDTADLSNWNGDTQSAEWIRLVEIVKRKLNYLKQTQNRNKLMRRPFTGILKIKCILVFYKYLFSELLLCMNLTGISIEMILKQS